MTLPITRRKGDRIYATDLNEIAAAVNALEVGGGGISDLTDLGVTATAAELNHVDGVTSAIQTQLDAKVPTSRTVNGAALSSNVTLTQDSIGDGATYKQFSSTEKTKLSGIATGATANSSDATLLDRTNHTGTQAQSTVTNLVTDLAAKAPLASPAFTGTPTGITKTHVGLGNVDNTADTAKPVSTAQQTALDLKAPLASPTFTGTVAGITKSMVGLGNVDNTADTAKPVSTAQQTALDLKAPLASPTFTGTVSGVTKTHVGLGNVDNTSDATKWAASKTLTNTTLDANGTGNSITNLEVADFAGTAIITAAETIASNNNDTSIPTSAAVKAYADSVGGGIPGLTSSAAELNILDGAILSTTELNYVDGVTSAIQTQLNAKATDSLAMHLAGAETVTGAKTFNAGTLLDKGSVVFNVKAYGATGDGTTDDTTNVRAALSAAISAGGGIVYFPAGTYKITPSGSPAIGLAVTGNNITLMGSGPYSSVIKKGGAGIAIDTSGTGSDYSGSMHLYSPSVIGLGVDSDYNSGLGVRAYYTSLMVMRDFALINNMDTGMDFAELWDSRFDNVRVITGGSETASQDKPAIWLRNSAAGSGFGLAGQSSNQVHFRGLHLETNLTGGLWIEPGPGSSAAVESIFIDNIKVEQHQINHTPLVKVNTGLGISMNNIFIHAGEFRGGYSTPVTVMDLSLEKSEVSNVFIGGSPTVTSIATGVNIHDSSRVRLSTIWGNYDASHGPTVAHLTWGSNLTDIEYSNVWSNSGTQFSGTPPSTSLLGNTSSGITGLLSMGVSATDVELNILDGATLSTTELNYVDGVTSAIQGQLNAKAPLASPAFTGTPTGITATHVGLGNVTNNAQYYPGGTDVAVADGGTGRSTSTTAYGLIAAGTTATGAHQTLAAGATTEVLVGGGASALPVWTTATGSGAPVRATSPTLVTPVLGTPSSGTLTNCTGLPLSSVSGTIAQLNTAITDAEMVVGSSNGTPTGKTLWTGTVAQYTAIGSKDSNTVYVQTA